MTIGERLVLLRGSTMQQEVAKSVGICSSALSMYEQNKRVPRDEIKVRLANYYGVTVQELFYSPDAHDS